MRVFGVASYLPTNNKLDRFSHYKSAVIGWTNKNIKALALLDMSTEFNFVIDSALMKFPEILMHHRNTPRKYLNQL